MDNWRLGKESTVVNILVYKVLFNVRSVSPSESARSHWGVKDERIAGESIVQDQPIAVLSTLSYAGPSNMSGGDFSFWADRLQVNNQNTNFALNSFHVWMPCNHFNEIFKPAFGNIPKWGVNCYFLEDGNFHSQALYLEEELLKIWRWGKICLQ